MLCNNIIFVLIQEELGLISYLNSKCVSAACTKSSLLCPCYSRFNPWPHYIEWMNMKTYIASIVTDGEVSMCQLWLAEAFMVFKSLIKFLSKCFIC